MSEEFSNAILYRFLRRLAASIEATEAFAFGIRAEGEGDRFPLLVHIRPDNSSEQVRRAAREKFIELALPCVQSGKDGAIELGTAGLEEAARDPQFCLISLVRWGERFTAPVAMIGFIARFPNMDAVKAALTRVQMTELRD